VLAGFAHAQTGSSTRLLRGLLSGLYGFVGFLVLMAATIARCGVALSFTLGFAVALTINAVVIATRRR
jgi:hypothetical protein